MLVGVAGIAGSHAASIQRTLAAWMTGMAVLKFSGADIRFARPQCCEGSIYCDAGQWIELAWLSRLSNEDTCRSLLRSSQRCSGLLGGLRLRIVGLWGSLASTSASSRVSSTHPRRHLPRLQTFLFLWIPITPISYAPISSLPMCNATILSINIVSAAVPKSRRRLLLIHYNLDRVATIRT